MSQDGRAEPEATTWWLRTIGELAFYNGAQQSKPVLHAGKPLALLAYVALSPGGRASRSRVSELFWPGSNPPDARHALSQAIYRLKEAANREELLWADGDDLAVSPEVRLDCLEGERAASQHDAERTYQLLRGTFLGRFSVSGSAEFEEWVETQRAKFMSLWGAAALKFARQLLEKGHPRQAAEIAEELAAEQPFDDEPVRTAMEAMAASGRHALAVARYAAHAEFLASDEDEPGPELTAYADELARLVKARETETNVLPFVGRTRQWAELESAWTHTREGKGGVVLVEGAAGIGKTRLISELRRRVQAAEGTVLAAKCYEPESAVPYGSLASALCEATDHPALDSLDPAWLGEAARLLPELKERFPQLARPTPAEGSQASKRRLHQALARFLSEVARDAPVLLAIDDVHWADPASLEVLHFLGHQLEDDPVLIVTSYRPAELSPSARSFARSLAGTRLAKLLVLDPFSTEEVLDLLQGLGESVDHASIEDLAKHLHRQSGGNPLFLSELLESLSRTGALFVRDGEWTWGSSGGIGELPKTIGKLLSERLEGLQDWVRACLEVMAVAASDIPVEFLARTMGISEPHAELAFSVLEEERLVQRTGVGRFDVLHDELRRHVYQGIPDDRRAMLHGAAGTALEDLGEAKLPGGPARLAYHFDQAGDLDRASRYALQAAGEASALVEPHSLQSHLDIAASHAPRPLPPGERPNWMSRVLGPGASPRRNRLAGAAFGVAIAALGLAGLGFLRNGTEAPPGDYRQGVLYLSQPGAAGPTDRVVWPSRLGARAEVQATTDSPESPPRVHYQWVSEGGETHLKLFGDDDNGPVQLTFGNSDDAAQGWSPDGRLLAITRGWRAGPNEFRSNVVLLDTLGREVRRITDTRFQDNSAAWSASGAQILVLRDSMGSQGLWLMDADGGNPVNVSAPLGVDSGILGAGLSTTGDRIALLVRDSLQGQGTFSTTDLSSGRTVATRVVPASPTRTRLVWSPDDMWIAYVASSGGESLLRVLRDDGSEGPYEIAAVPGSPRLDRWNGDEPQYVALVAASPAVVELAMGEGIRAAATATTTTGHEVPVSIRWTVADSSVALVDELGFVRGRRPGSTTLIASAGGFRSDTIGVNVAFSAVDTVMVDDWEAGLDKSRWRAFGQPRPEVVTGPGGQVFSSNGDYNHSSGAVLNRELDPHPAGFTVEVDGWVDFTGGPFQDWALRMTPDPAAALGAEILEGLLIEFGIWGPNPAHGGPLWAGCVATTSREEGNLDVGAINRRWYRGAIQVRPDSVAECYLDGKLLSQGRIPDSAAGRPLSLVLAGRSEGAEIYHGQVTITRGLRH